ncbi:MAG: VanZ family protein [Nanoarchaeota archaeon]|nr:VanZ family protein [Nanoarchaeota archaeon]
MLRWFEKHNKISWGITILTAVFIFYMSSKVFEAPSVGGLLSIVYHTSVFAFLNFFLFISSLRGEKKYSVFFLGFSLAMLYGILDELHQFFVPGRTCTIVDVGYDSFGILISSMLYLVFLNRNPKPNL